MRKTREGAFAVLGGSILVAYGFVGLATSNYLSSLTQLATGDYLRLWSLAILMVASGFLAIAGGFLIASVGSWRVFGGGVLGILGSILGALMSLALLTTTVGLSQNIAGFGPTAQYSVSYEILFIGCIAAMFMGFPLGMYGSMAGIVGEEAEQPSQAAEAT